ncbi:hypothetical protein Sango_1201400 [Sesamum angolense]|uniref:Uncharacterized protein n=1 Tax=Sesamum angolense TaxID=2727404 RepID=A0AAE2BX38_9LAMI|nr:hypothetical protein Sango_1201400 [Sesamum angolense]
MVRLKFLDSEYKEAHGHRLARRKLKNAFSILHLLTLRGLYRESGENGQEKVVLSPAEVKSLHSELAALDERNLIVKLTRLSGYLFLRTRWAALPGEPPPVDDAEVDDWLPRFVVLHGSYIYLYMMATDLSPQDSTRLSDIVEVGHLPCITREDEETQYCFYILTRQGLRYECATPSKIQHYGLIASWYLISKDLNHLRNGEDPCKHSAAVDVPRDRLHLIVFLQVLLLSVDIILQITLAEVVFAI